MGSTPAAIWAGRQWRRPKTRKSIRPPRAFEKRIGFTEAGRLSSASTAFACSGTARVLSLVLVFLILPFAYARKAVLHVTRKAHVQRVTVTRRKVAGIEVMPPRRSRFGC